MNTEKIKPLEQLHDALVEVENARARSDLTNTERAGLEQAAVKLRNLERAVIRAKTNDMIKALTNDTADLKKLAGEMFEKAKRLESIANVIEKAATVVDVFVQVVTTAASAGLL